MKLKSVIKQKKGQLAALAPAVIALVIAAVFLILGLVILQELRDTSIVSAGTKVNDSAFAGANLTLVGLATFADFWEIIVLAIVISVVIGLLLVVFGGSTRGAR